MNGMGDNEGADEYFADDDLDALPDNALHELEQNALRSTQQYTVVMGQGYDEGIEQQHAVRNLPYQTTASRALNPQPAVSGTSHRQQEYGQYNVNQLNATGLDEGHDATPKNERDSYFPVTAPCGDEIFEIEDWRQVRYSRAHPLQKAHPFGPPGHDRGCMPHKDNGYTEPAFDVEMQDSMLLGDHSATIGHSVTSHAEEKLGVRIADLLRERDELAEELHSTKSTVLTQKGEIAIIRANQSKESRNHDRQLAAVKRSMQEDAAKHMLQMEKANEENKRMDTENLELNHELTLEMEKVKRVQQEQREKLKKENANGNVTPPKKMLSLPLRDGFDDVETMAASPAKPSTPSKRTPTVGAKRKRRNEDASPIKPLVLRQASTGQLPDTRVPSMEGRKEVLEQHDFASRKSLRFMQRMLNHRCPATTERILEAFTKYAFPSCPTRAFSSIVLEAIARLTGASLPSDFLKFTISLWFQSLKEKYYRPIALLIDIVQFVFALDGEVLTAEIIQQLLPVLKSSCDLNGVPRFLHSPVSKHSYGKFYKTPREALKQEVDGTACLEILYGVACACLQKEKYIRLFWQSIDLDFVLMMLNSSQPISDISLMLNILSTSIMSDTFGIICAAEVDQTTIESYIVERLSCLLWETPREDEGDRAYTNIEVSELRVEALELLSSLALSPVHPHNDQAYHGSIFLARHANVIGRICRCMYDEVDALYAYAPGPELHARLVNDATRLVYRLLQLHGDHIDIQKKLEVVNGGFQKHRVVLTRLAYTEDLFLEAGITEETAMMAHEMLEDSVTPEEAEMLAEAYPAHKGRKDESQS